MWSIHFSGKLDAPVEILESPPVPRMCPGGADDVERMSLQIGETQLLRHLERLSTDTDCLVVLACDHQESSDCADDARLGGRDFHVLDQSTGPLQVVGRLVAVSSPV